MVTSGTWGRRSQFRVDRWAELFINTLYHYRGGAYLLHEFVLMPDHFHILITPQITLERAVQYVKGGFSFRAKKALGSGMEVWQKGFQDHRIRDGEDCAVHVRYIHENPVRKRLCESPWDYVWSSARPGYELDEVPQGLKPRETGEVVTGAPKGAPFQNNVTSKGGAEGAALQENFNQSGAPKAAPLQNHTDDSTGAPEGTSFQEVEVKIGNSIGAAKAGPFQN